MFIPFLCIEDILDALSWTTYFTTLDVTSGYHQIFVADKDVTKTEFQTRSGFFEYVRIPYESSNAP